MAQPNPANTFLLEADDLLTQIEEIALDIDPQSPDPEAVNQLFRAFHTIKGSGSMFGFDAVAAFTHHVETVLDQVRSDALELSQTLLELVLAAKDQIKMLLDAAQGGPAPADGSGERIISALSALSVPDGGGLPSVENAAAAIATPDASQALENFRIRFRPDRAILTFGANPVPLLNELRALGECEIVVHTDAIPSLDQIQPEQCYLWWDITLSTGRGQNAIKDVFIFVEDGSEITIEQVAHSEAAERGSRGSVLEYGGFPPLSKQDGPTNDPSAFIATGLSTSFAGRINIPGAIPGAPRSESGGEPKPFKTPSRSTNASSTRKSSTQESTVRVPSERLDRLVALVGEMVMNQSRITQVAAGIDLPNLTVPVEELERLVAELRDNVLSIRMMPIGATFSRFKRLVHDLSTELGKEIDLVTEGGETELDKTVLDQLGDPLVHLIRNSLDHGIESAEIRQRNGKPRRGTIRLAAAHIGSSVVVTIEDDGQGLDTEAIRAKAIEKKLISPETALSEKEIFNLILLPGFSTAKEVTSVSGRGVGLDVVKRQIDALRGSVSISSQPGKGTTISLTLPLTLAIIEGLLVEIGRDQFIVPMSSVTENVELHRAERTQNNGRNVIAVRGELIPYIRLRELFGETAGELDVEKIVIMQHEDRRVGLVVDRVLGSHQTVIQSLGRFYRNIEIVSGATIMGDGRVALIFDLAGLVRFDRRQAETLKQINNTTTNKNQPTRNGHL